VTRTRRVGFGLLLGLLLVGGMSASVTYAQPDSTRAALLEEKGFPPDHSPRGALWRALAAPGWGQFYNRQYFKMPFVYAGLAGGGFAIFELNRRYNLFRKANLFKIGQNRAAEEGGENPYQQFEDEFNQAVERLGGEEQVGNVSGRQLRDLRDNNRRWRDLSLLGAGLFYILTVVDAYVSAHLLTFDVGEVAVDVRPTGGERLASKGGPNQWGSVEGPFVLSPSDGIGVRVRMRF
jgi:hypothetical protein